MKLTDQHKRILEELDLRDGRTLRSLGLKNRRAMQTLNGWGLVYESGPNHNLRWHITPKGRQEIASRTDDSMAYIAPSQFDVAKRLLDDWLSSDIPPIDLTDDPKLNLSRRS